MSLPGAAEGIAVVDAPARPSSITVPGCALRDPNLLGNDLRVWAALILLGGSAGHFDGGVEHIAEWTALSTRTANRSLKRLITMGYIGVKRRQRKTSLISVRTPDDVYGEATISAGTKIDKVLRRRGPCPTKRARRSP